ncbi:hypothetical protein VCRA2116O29_10214 [Vibrio crassostreae]|nr:hypothetical protein VCRA2116O29_10214 [Vibrio crassostreae]CAK2486805.1 hypothetical protein VCRA2119O48_30015 [Vibrio crassostreae]CAK2652834.1 hypothetical protein VCRA2133E348_120014 [Vibrio crassostreae]CAK3112986.1 hypothetical protein VCRA213O314_100015 [Vibrio crassostreae]CAK3662772.1 hypothetical protein VCRA2123O74_10016 [Vibrio crassostreae]
MKNTTLTILKNSLRSITKHSLSQIPKGIWLSISELVLAVSGTIAVVYLPCAGGLYD